MKPTFLLVFFSVAIVVPFALFSDDEDPVDQRIRESEEKLAEHSHAFSEAVKYAVRTGDYTFLPDVWGAYLKAQEDHAPSQLDVWDARHRLLDLIHDSDDETVAAWYVLVKESIAEDEAFADGVAKLLFTIDRTEQNNAARGVDLTPAPPEH